VFGAHASPACLASLRVLARPAAGWAYFPHAILELIALFLPLAAWIIASRRGEWEQLLAATVVTVRDGRTYARHRSLDRVSTSRRIFHDTHSIHPPIVRNSEVGSYTIR